MPRPAEVVPRAEPRVPAAPADAGRTALLVAAAALVGLAAVTFLNPSASRIHTWPLGLVAFFWSIAPIITLAILLARGRVERRPPMPVFVGGALLAVATLTSALASPFAAASLPHVWPTLGGLAWYGVLHHALTAGPRRLENEAMLTGALGVSAAALAAVSLFQWSGGSWPLPWGGRNAAPFGHSTYTAGAMVLGLPWIALQAWRARSVRRIAWGIALVCACLALASTESRGGALALGAICGLAVVVVLVRSNSSKSRKLAFAAGIMAVAGAAVFTNSRLRDLVIHRGWSEGAAESNRQRAAMISAGVKLGAVRMLSGWGPGTVPLAYPRVRAQLEGGTENILQLHNTPVQLWATTGILGGVAAVLLVAGTVVAGTSARRSPATFAAASSLAGYGVMALTDHQLDVPFFAAFAAAALALLTAADARDQPASRAGRAGGLAAAVVVAMVIPALGPTVADLRARRLYDAALTALERGDSPAYLRLLDQATAVVPHDPFFDHQSASWWLDQRGTTPDDAAQRAAAAAARARLERSLGTGAHTEFAHFNLGWLLLDLGEADAAARHFSAAARLVPDKGGVYFGMSLAHQAAGRRDAAVRCHALEIINDPRQITSPAWDTPLLSPLKTAVLEEVHQRLGALRGVPHTDTIDAWLRWWSGAKIPPTGLQPGFSEASRRFATALVSIERNAVLPSRDLPWEQAYAAWREASSPAAVPEAEAFRVIAGSDREFARALFQRARRYSSRFQEFLTASTGDEASFVRTLRRQRPGYGMLTFHPEGPILHDLYIVQENRIAVDLAAGLFPAKGWLAGRWLLELVPEIPK